MVKNGHEQTLGRLPSSLGVETHRTFSGLTVYPVLPTERGSDPGDPGFLTLDGALETGRFEVTEVSREGSVPELRVVNETDRPVLLLDGEELVGAKQNRVLNVTVLCPAGKTISIPVSCVEQGRWAHKSPKFAAADALMYSAGRAAKAAGVAEHLNLGHGYRSDQARVWGDIAQKAARMGTKSPTGALQDVVDDNRRRLDDFVRELSVIEGQVGAVFALGSRPVGMEFLDHPAVFRSVLPKLVRSYALDAIEIQDQAHEVPTIDAARDFVDELSRVSCEARPAVGLGTDLRLSGDRVIGSALIVDDRVIHLSAFRRESTNHDPGSNGGSPPSRRPSRLARWTRRRSS